MRKIYLDIAEVKGSVVVSVKNAEIIPAGTTIYSMSIGDKNKEYQRYAKEYDIEFIFDDCIPNIDFYTIPHVDIMAKDSEGGFIGTLGQTSDLESNSPICYINKNLECFLVAENGVDFISNIKSWKDNLEPYNKILFYTSREEASLDLKFIEIGEELIDKL